MNEDPLNPSGGLGVHVRELCDCLRMDDGLDVTVAAVDYQEQRGGFFSVGSDVQEADAGWEYQSGKWRLLKIFNRNQYNTCYGPLTSIITERNFLDNLLSPRILGRQKFDLIHLHDSTLWNVAERLRVAWEIPVVVTCHLSNFLVHNKNPANPYYMYDVQTEENCFGACDRLIVCSDEYNETIREAYLCDFVGRKTDVIANGIDAEFLKTVKRNQETRDRFGDKPLVVFVGRLVQSKGVDLVLDAVEALPDYHFVLISNIAPTLEARNLLTTRMSKMKVDNLSWLNNIPQAEKWAIMKVADIPIMPSLHEPFGLVALEWMGLGHPPIVSRIGGLQGFCIDENAHMIEPSAKALIGAIKVYASSDEMRACARETARIYTWEKTAAKVAGLYGEVLHAA